MPIPPKSRRTLAGAVIAAALPLAGQAAAPPGSAPGLEDNSQLETLARTEAALHLPALTPHERFIAGPINPDVKLVRCSLPVKHSVGPGSHMRDRVLVELRCPGAPAWHLYVPVRIVGTSQVTVAAHAIVAGTVLTANDVRTEQRDISQLPPGYMDDPTVTVGLTASRPISSGAVITNQLLLGAKAVQRGQTVTLLADGGGVSISMEGRALSDALVNQRVKVENLSSGKVVEGIARSQQVVEIILQ
ncbi:MAG TPA: flagellar basal body P-ring formation chaperone FlgA [Steroidobacteraceae bacterium]|jgi:flagella basal body P-ring formation protein FlgA|nr:flagellar basal body P-ring formation chaperone FlgA [Steroidobacteraceae bacterium]